MRNKQKAWRYYKRWRQEKTYCPAFNSNVIISLKGWRHLTGATGTKKRSFKDVYRRLKLLPYAKKIIKKSTTIQNITKKGKQKFYVLEAMEDVKEKGRKAPRKIRIVFTQDKRGNKIFLSVMDKKVKNRQEKRSASRFGG